MLKINAILIGLTFFIKNKTETGNFVTRTLICYRYFDTGFIFSTHYQPPEGGRLYDMKVVSGYAFLRTYYV